MKDTVHYKQLRQKLLNSIHQKGINDTKVLEAMNRVPRHIFVNPEDIDRSYDDCTLSIGQDQTISQPYTVAYQTSLLGIKSGDKVLEVGTGSGYQAAILCELGAQVFSIERRYKLYISAKSKLAPLGLKINLFYGDGGYGIEQAAPFDKIIVTAATDHIPDKLLEQLKINGILVAPVGRDVQKMLRITKGENALRIEELDHFQFVPLLEGVE